MRTPLKTTLRAAGSAIALASVLAAPAGVARAAEPGPDTLPINVVTIQSDGADDQSEALTKALRTAVRNMAGWSLGAGDYSLEVLTLSLKCADIPDANCQSRIADQIKSDRYVWGRLKKKGANVVGDVHLWVRGKGTSNFNLDYAANVADANDDALKRIASDAINQLTGGPPKGSVHVKTGGVSGQVFVDGQPLGAIKGDGNFLVPSGPHKLTVKAVGFNDMDTQIVVKPTGAAAEVSLNMVAAADTSPINGRRVGGAVAIGLGAVFAIVGFASMAEVASAQSTINTKRNSTPESASFDWCSSANTASNGLSDACSKGKTFQTMQIVMFPLAAVAGGVGIYLVATSGKSAPKPTTGFSVNPQLGPGNGKLDISYTF
jgi:hypothetical protein